MADSSTTQQNDGTSGTAANPAASTPPDAPSGEITETEKLRREIAELTSQLQRERADFVNYRARTRGEAQDWFRKGKAEAVLALVPVIENLSRASSSMPADANGSQWREALSLIIRLAERQLSQLRVERIATVGEPFDSSLHEAISQDNGTEGTILREVEPGYVLEGKPLSVAKVVIGNGRTGAENGPVENQAENA